MQIKDIYIWIYLKSCSWWWKNKKKKEWSQNIQIFLFGDLIKCVLLELFVFIYSMRLKENTWIFPQIFWWFGILNWLKFVKKCLKVRYIVLLVKNNLELNINFYIKLSKNLATNKFFQSVQAKSSGPKRTQIIVKVIKSMYTHSNGLNPFESCAWLRLYSITRYIMNLRSF